MRSSMVLSLISRLESCPGISKSFPGTAEKKCRLAERWARNPAMFRMVGYIWLSISRGPGTVRSVSYQDDQDERSFPKIPEKISEMGGMPTKSPAYGSRLRGPEIMEPQRDQLREPTTSNDVDGIRQDLKIWEATIQA